MNSIGIHPALKSRPHMYGRLQRDYHLTTVSGGKYDHLVTLGITATVKPAARNSTSCRTHWNGGGDAA